MENIELKITSLEFQIKRYETMLKNFGIIKDDSPERNKNYAKTIGDKIKDCQGEIERLKEMNP